MFNDVEYTIMPDIIVVGLLCTAAITGGNIILNRVLIDYLQLITKKLCECGCSIKISGNSISLSGPNRLTSLELLKTLPYPGFPTNMQTQMVDLLSIANGTSIVTETIFKNRFRHATELVLMGENIELDGRFAVIKGVDKLKGSNVSTSDIRGGTALVLAGLVAEGTTSITGIEHIERGYEDFDKILLDLGVDVIVQE